MNKELRILVTGANGFLGKHVLNKLLEVGYNNIIGTYRQNPIHNIPVNWIKMDLTQGLNMDELLSQVDVVIHLAALVSYVESDKVNLLKNNHLATRELLNNCLYHKVKKFLFVSSASTLTKSSFPFEISESHQGKPVFYSNYAKSKYLAELEVHRSVAEGLNAVILNPCLILGEGDWNRGSLSILKRISEGLEFYPSGSLGIVDVQKVVKSIQFTLENEYPIGPHLLHNYTIRYKDFIEMTCDLLGLPSPKNEISRIHALWFAKIEGLRAWLFGQKKVITKETAFLSSQTFKYIEASNRLTDQISVEDLRNLIKRSLRSSISI